MKPHKIIVACNLLEIKEGNKKKKKTASIVVPFGLLLIRNLIFALPRRSGIRNRRKKRIEKKREKNTGILHYSFVYTTIAHPLYVFVTVLVSYFFSSVVQKILYLL